MKVALFICSCLIGIPEIVVGKEISISLIRKEFPNILPGKAISIEKVFNEKTRKIHVKSDFEGIKNVEGLLLLEAAERQAQRTKYGALSVDLFRKLELESEEFQISVAVTLKSPKGIVHPIRGSLPPNELKAHSKTISQLRPIRRLEGLLLQYGVEVERTVDDFTSIAKMTKSVLLKIAQDNNVSKISEAEPVRTTSFRGAFLLPTLFSQTTVDYVTLARSAYSHSQDPLPSNLASGVNVATFESGLKPSVVSCMQVSPNAYDHMTIPFTNGNGVYIQTDSLHSLQTFTALVNAAPGANLYHRNSWNYFSTPSQDYIIDNEIKSVSMSVSRSSDPTHIDNRTIDDFVYRYPYPIFSNPAGISGWQDVAYWGAYNAMSVGNVQDSAHVHFKVDTCHPATQTRNPIPTSSGVCIDGGSSGTCRSDREMPYIVAPGWSPFASTNQSCGWVTPAIHMATPCVTQDIHPGTSSSAPTLNGMIGSLLGQSSTSWAWPELTRAILLQTARNVNGGEWDNWTDGKDGAGVVHGADAIAFANGASYQDSGNAAAIRGYHTDTHFESDFTNSVSKTFNIAIPNPKPSNKHLRIVFTWDSFPDFVNGENLLCDFDIVATSNSGNYNSSSYDSNIEIIDIPASNLTAGGTYSVTVYPFAWRRPTDSRTNYTYSALTWDFVADHAH